MKTIKIILTFLLLLIICIIVGNWLYQNYPVLGAIVSALMFISSFYLPEMQDRSVGLSEKEIRQAVEEGANMTEKEYEELKEGLREELNS